MKLLLERPLLTALIKDSFEGLMLVGVSLATMTHASAAERR